MPGTALVVDHNAGGASGGGERGSAGIDGRESAGDVEAHYTAGSSSARSGDAVIAGTDEEIVFVERSVMELG